MSGLVPGRDFLMMMIMEVFLKQGKRIGISIKLNLKGFFGKWEGWYFFILSRFRCHDHDDSIRCLGIFCTGFWCRFFCLFDDISGLSCAVRKSDICVDAPVIGQFFQGVENQEKKVSGKIIQIFVSVNILHFELLWGKKSLRFFHCEINSILFTAMETQFF